MALSAGEHQKFSFNMKVVKYILGVFFALGGIGSIAQGGFGAGLVMLILGVAILPPVSDQLKEKFKFWQNKSVRYGSYVVLFIISGVLMPKDGSFSSNFDRNSTQSKSTSPEEKYPVYTEWAKESVSMMNEQEKADRQEILDGLTQTVTYDSIVNKKIVAVEYVPVINAIANGITYFKSDEGFAIEDNFLQEIQKLENGKDKVTFALKCAALAQTKKGGLTPELISMFDRYRHKFKLYGEPSNFMDANGKIVEENPYNYDFTPIFAMLDPKNEKFIEAIYEAKNKNITDWRSEDEDLAYPFMSNAKEYGKRLLYVNPKSEILPKGLNDDFWNEYDPMVKERALDLIIRKDCAGLQDEFNTTADNLDRFHAAGKTSNQNLEHMDFLDEVMKKLGCYRE